jgi:hypothetical protein
MMAKKLSMAAIMSGGAERGPVGGCFRQLAHAHTVAGFNGGIVFLRRFGFGGVAALDNVEFDGHDGFSLWRVWFEADFTACFIINFAS